MGTLRCSILDIVSIIDLVRWAFAFRHGGCLSVTSTSAPSRDQAGGKGISQKTILLFARAPVCVMPFYSPVVVSFSITISFNFSARPDSFQHIEHVRHSMVDWQRGKNKQRPVASDSDGH